MTDVSELPPVTSGQLATAIVPLVVPGGGIAGQDLPGSISLLALAGLVNTGTLPPQQISVSSATGTPLPGLPTIPAAGGVVLLQGSLIAQDIITKDLAQFNVSLTVKRLPNNPLCASFGDTTPSVFGIEGVFGSIQSPVLETPILGFDDNGPVIIVSGLTGRIITWTYTLNCTSIS